MCTSRMVVMIMQNVYEEAHKHSSYTQEALNKKLRRGIEMNIE